MSGFSFKITEPDGSVYDHGDALHAQKSQLVEAHKRACDDLAQAEANYTAAIKELDEFIFNFKGHRQTFQQKTRAMRKKVDTLRANRQQKKHQLAELQCTLEPSVREQMAMFLSTATSTAASAPVGAPKVPSIVTVADMTLLARVMTTVEELRVSDGAFIWQGHEAPH